MPGKARWPWAVVFSPELHRLLREYRALKSGNGAPDLLDTSSDTKDLTLDTKPMTSEDVRRAWISRYRTLASVEVVIAEAERVREQILDAMTKLPEAKGKTVDHIDEWRAVFWPVKRSWSAWWSLATAIDALVSVVSFERGLAFEPPDWRFLEVVRLRHVVNYKCLGKRVYSVRAEARRKRAEYDGRPSQRDRRHEHIRALRADPEWRSRENQRARERYAAKKNAATHASRSPST